MEPVGGTWLCSGMDCPTLVCPGAADFGDTTCDVVVANDSLVTCQCVFSNAYCSTLVSSCSPGCQTLPPGHWTGVSNEHASSVFFVRTLPLNATASDDPGTVCNVSSGCIDKSGNGILYAFPYTFMQGCNNGPGAYTMCLFQMTPDAIYGQMAWMIPRAINFSNASVQTTFVVNGEVIQPGATYTYWAPPPAHLQQQRAHRHQRVAPRPAQQCHHAALGLRLPVRQRVDSGVLQERPGVPRGHRARLGIRAGQPYPGERPNL